MLTELLAKHEPTQVYESGDQPFHIIQSQQFSREWLLQDLFPLAAQMEEVVRRRKYDRVVDERLRGVIGLHAFYESSTRTRLSFQQAATMLGATFSSTENARVASSAAKGESVEDSTRIEDGYAFNYIVLRHDKQGGALRAANKAQIPIINAGDGDGQHPTQALLDLDTILKELGQIGDQRITFVGDQLFGRTNHSLTYLLSKFPNMRFDFVSPPNLRMKPEILEHLKEHQVPYQEWDNLENEVLKSADVVYVTRAQTERFAKKRVPLVYATRLANTVANKMGLRQLPPPLQVGLAELDKMKKDAIVMHPLPRNEELPPEVEDDPRVKIFPQAQNGLYIRMALLDMILNGRTA